ncbi:MAG: DnaB-like helicase C-terminal domain-containing protein, partial [Rhodoferax sp.]
TKELCKEPGVAEIIIAKQRNGPTGTVKLAFLRQHTKFENLAYSDGGDYSSVGQSVGVRAHRFASGLTRKN